MSEGAANNEIDPVDYFLVRGDDDSDDPSDEAADDVEGQARADHRTKLVALTGLAAVVIILAVTIGLVSLVETSHRMRPTSPQAAAQQWGNALVQGDRATRRQLECAGGSPSGKGLTLVAAVVSRVRAGTATRSDPTTWTVPMQVDGAGGSGEDTVSLTVVRSQGEYRVC